MSVTPFAAPLPTHLDLVNAPERVGGEDAMREMLPMLSDMLERDGPVIDDLLVQGDVQAAGKLLHSLKGCMPIFCHEPLCKAVADLEMTSKKGQLDEARTGYAALRPQLQQLQHEINVYMTSWGPK